MNAEAKKVFEAAIDIEQDLGTNAAITWLLIHGCSTSIITTVLKTKYQRVVNVNRYLRVRMSTAIGLFCAIGGRESISVLMRRNGFKYHEIGASMGLSAQTIRMDIQRAAPELINSRA